MSSYQAVAQVGKGVRHLLADSVHKVSDTLFHCCDTASAAPSRLSQRAAIDDARRVLQKCRPCDHASSHRRVGKRCKNFS